MDELKNFTAVSARELVDSLNEEELYEILGKIRIEAQSKKSVLHVYKSLSKATITELGNRGFRVDSGFRVVDQPSIAVEKENLYYSINW